MAQTNGQHGDYFLAGYRVIELADEQAEYCGRLLSGLGADVIKVEPPGGNPTRRIGPFYQDKEDPEGSLYFWQYNIGKRSVTLDIEQQQDREKFLQLLSTADVLLESTPGGYLERLGLGRDELLKRYPSLIIARMSPFGSEGPWAAYKGSDLVHLALGGPMMNTGYDPDLDGKYDLPPIAPQMWQAYHIAGEQLGIVLLGAMLHQRDTGQGQFIECPVHQTICCNTEIDIMNWVFRRAPVFRQTCRHAAETMSPYTIGVTKDGRWMMGFPPMGGKGVPTLVEFLKRYNAEADLEDERVATAMQDRTAAMGGSEVGMHLQEVVQRLFRRTTYDKIPWREAQDAGLLWTPVRKPHENALDPHWLKRGSIGDVEHPELGKSFKYTLRKWVSSAGEWKTGPRAPRIGEHTTEVLGELSNGSSPRIEVPATPVKDDRRSRWQKPFALHGVRIMDFTWWLASGGAPRFLSALGAENIKVEWKGNMDLRLGMGQYPVGGKDARMNATAALPPDMSTINRSGQFNDFHAGQRGVSLNLRHPEGLALAKRLLSISDIVAEGFSPGVMESWGFGYEVMKSVKPDIIYTQQSGFGATGVYGKFRAVGPIAGSAAAITELSGMPEPYPPAGWGYSYLDWFGAYNLATAMMAALHYRARTGKGMWIDSSQVDSGIFITGTSVLDWSANGRVWQRYGNRSPYKPAAPHGAYRCAGDDRWVAIACYTEEEWQALTEVANKPEWRNDPRFRTLKDRLANQDELDALVNAWTSTSPDYDLMNRLQKAGVAAGVCQNAEDRCDKDPQLKALRWFTDVDHTEMGRWPVKEIPVHMSETPPFMGGDIDRAAPCYGEDNEYVYGELLGISSKEIARLAEDGII